ncbi:MAG: 3-oxoacyl-ACP reductase FabG [Bacteroidetes bacterium]|nr:3-oxoacyl-ACP reductase FabG [Bacteroidota bacterium]MCB0847390.1 3-oxoacyl-ACP reductase FabG [Bacteroidota bacterium]
MRLKDKVAIITGAARGIGKGAVKVFTKEGARVVIWDVLDEGENTAASFREQGYEVIFRKVNTTDRSQVEAEVQHVVDQFGRIDILVNNAGITRDSSFLKMSYAQWDQVMDVNLNGVFNCTKAIAPLMKAQGFGRIINTSSIVGIHGAFGQANYAATKAGVIAMTKTLAKELGKYGITVNAVAPGYIHTEMTMAIPDEIREKMIAGIPTQRAGKPEDIAYAYLYLASDEASYVNGHTLSVNGGVG